MQVVWIGSWIVAGTMVLIAAIGVAGLIAMAVSYTRRKLEWYRLTSIDVATPERLHMHGRYGPGRPAGDVDPQHRGELPPGPGADMLIDGFGQPHGFPVRRPVRTHIRRMP